MHKIFSGFLRFKYRNAAKLLSPQRYLSEENSNDDQSETVSFN